MRARTGDRRRNPGRRLTDPQGLERALESLGWIGFEAQGLTRDRMSKREEHGVQRLAAQVGRDASQLRVADRCPVERIPEDRVPMLQEVNADLMSATCLETATNQGASVQKLDCFEVRDRSAAPVAARGEFLSMRRVPTVERIVRDRLWRPAERDRQVCSL